MPNNLKTISELLEMEVLYVEDDEIISDIFIKMIERMVKQVHYCQNGKEGFEMYQNLNPDIIITDIKMPIMNGLEMSRLIRDRDSDIPIIIVSAYNETEFLKEAFEIGITYYVNKPINRLELMRTLNESAKSVVYKRHHSEMVENYEETIDAFVDLIERRDRYTAGHTFRVAHYCQLIAKEMRIDEKQISLLEKAARLHDIGKIEIPDSILLNPSRFNDLEYSIVKEHLNSGYAVLSKIKQYRNLAEIMRYHHEHYDGSGYPQGVKGEEIPMLAHILIFADAFDAMTSNRIYRTRMSVSETFEEIKSLSGKQFHPDVIPAALKVLEKIEIDVNINQMPQSTIEEKKFSYFFSDPLTGLFNENYLKLLVRRKEYKDNEIGAISYVTVIDIHKISLYNKKNGWAEGNVLIKRIASFLQQEFPKSLIFRIRGDKFFLLLEDKYTSIDETLQTIIDDKSISFDIIEHTFEDFFGLNYFDV